MAILGAGSKILRICQQINKITHWRQYNRDKANFWHPPEWTNSVHSLHRTTQNHCFQHDTKFVKEKSAMCNAAFPPVIMMPSPNESYGYRPARPNICITSSPLSSSQDPLAGLYTWVPLMMTVWAGRLTPHAKVAVDTRTCHTMSSHN